MCLFRIRSELSHVNEEEIAVKTECERGDFRADGVCNSRGESDETYRDKRLSKTSLSVPTVHLLDKICVFHFLEMNPEMLHKVENGEEMKTFCVDEGTVRDKY